MIITAPKARLVGWAEKEGAEWYVYDADSETGQHITKYQKDSHYVSMFPVFDGPVFVSHPTEAVDAANDNALVAQWFATNNKYIVKADFDAWLEQAYRDGLKDGRRTTKPT